MKFRRGTSIAEELTAGPLLTLLLAVGGLLVPTGPLAAQTDDEATALHLPFPATVAGVEVEPGSYSLYAVPGERSWRIVVNADARRWGVPIDEEVRKRDIGTGTVPAERREDTVELLTIRLRRLSPYSAEMRIEWERTAVSVPIARRPLADSP